MLAYFELEPRGSQHACPKLVTWSGLAMTRFDPDNIRIPDGSIPGITIPFRLPGNAPQIATCRNVFPGQLEISAAQALTSWAVNRTPGRTAWSLSASFASTTKSGIPFATAWVSLMIPFGAIQQNIQHYVRVPVAP
jgi:hypothetical protein